MFMLISTAGANPIDFAWLYVGFLGVFTVIYSKKKHTTEVEERVTERRGGRRLLQLNFSTLRNPLSLQAIHFQGVDVKSLKTRQRKMDSQDQTCEFTSLDKGR